MSCISQKTNRIILALAALMLIVSSTPNQAEARDPGMRQRVLANIAASKKFRQENKGAYAKWFRASKNGFRNWPKRPAPNRNPRTGPTNVPHNYVIRGGGSQPSVLVDKSERRLKRNIRRKAAKLRMKPNMKPWEKIDYLQKVIRQKVKHAGNELDVKKNPNKYNRFNKKMSSSGKLAQLGDYLKMHKVVCREMAHITQVALEDAGFKSRLVYGTIKKKGKIIGGHAWNEVYVDKKWQIVDTTNLKFNKTDPKVAANKGTKNGWIWQRDTYGPRVVPKEQYRQSGSHFWF